VAAEPAADEERADATSDGMDAADENVSDERTTDARAAGGMPKESVGIEECAGRGVRLAGKTCDSSERADTKKSEADAPADEHAAQLPDGVAGAEEPPAAEEQMREGVDVVEECAGGKMSVASPESDLDYQRSRATTSAPSLLEVIAMTSPSSSSKRRKVITGRRQMSPRQTVQLNNTESTSATTAYGYGTNWQPRWGSLHESDLPPQSPDAATDIRRAAHPPPSTSTVQCSDCPGCPTTQNPSTNGNRYQSALTNQDIFSPTTAAFNLLVHQLKGKTSAERAQYHSQYFEKLFGSSTTPRALDFSFIQASNDTAATTTSKSTSSSSQGASTAAPLSKAVYNNKELDMTATSDHPPVDGKAFHFYKPKSNGQPGKHQAEGKPADFNLKKAASDAASRAKMKVGQSKAIVLRWLRRDFRQTFQGAASDHTTATWLILSWPCVWLPVVSSVAAEGARRGCVFQ